MEPEEKTNMLQSPFTTEDRRKHMKKGIFITVICVLAVAAIALGMLYYTNNEDKTRQIKTLMADADKQADQIEKLSADVEDQALKIEGLDADAETRAGEETRRVPVNGRERSRVTRISALPFSGYTRTAAI